MWLADNWKDYEVIDTDKGEKLERWGKYRLQRPDPQVIWNAGRDKDWKKVNGIYHRSNKGGGQWEFIDLPETWSINYDLVASDTSCVSDASSDKSNSNNINIEETPSDKYTLTFNLKPFAFKHTGVFPEQAVNWSWCYSLIKKANRPIKVLNLFAYTGGATIAAAAAGANVTHVDASKGMVGWAKENAASSGLGDAPIRWIVDDCKKFVEREIRRGKKYDAIIMDPPSYGRGPSGEIWKIEEAVFDLVKLCSQLLSDNPLFYLINSYTTGLQPGVLTYMLGLALKGYKGHIASDEIGLPVTKTGLALPCGASGRWWSE